MSKLTHPARDLIAAARAGEAPPRDARDRVRARVMARVGAGVAVGSATVLGASSSAAKTALTGSLALKLLLAAGLAGAVAVAAVKGGLLQASPPEDRAGVPVLSESAHRAPVSTGSPPATATQKPSPSVSTSPPSPSAERLPAPRAASTATVRAPPLPSTVRPSAEAPSLDDETALLARANAELVAGHPDRALAAYDEHNTQFKGGVLGEEERAGRILALCAAGRTAEARAEAQRFLAESPRSPMAARVESSCAGEQHLVPSATSSSAPRADVRPSDDAKARSLP